MKRIKMDSVELIRLRKQCDWTQKQAAKYFGISTQAYSRAECGYGIRSETGQAIKTGFQMKLREMEKDKRTIQERIDDLENRLHVLESEETSHG